MCRPLLYLSPLRGHVLKQTQCLTTTRSNQSTGDAVKRIPYNFNSSPHNVLKKHPTSNPTKKHSRRCQDPCWGHIPTLSSTYVLAASDSRRPRNRQGHTYARVSVIRAGISLYGVCFNRGTVDHVWKARDLCGKTMSLCGVFGWVVVYTCFL